MSPPIIVPYYSSPTALYRLSYYHLFSSDHIPVHSKFTHHQNLFQFIIHLPISRAHKIKYFKDNILLLLIRLSHPISITFISTIIITPHQHTLFQLIRIPISFIIPSLIFISPYSSSLNISPSADHNPVHYTFLHNKSR